jgi:hypothetical protein
LWSSCTSSSQSLLLKSPHVVRGAVTDEVGGLLGEREPDVDVAARARILGQRGVAAVGRLTTAPRDLGDITVGGQRLAKRSGDGEVTQVGGDGRLRGHADHRECGSGESAGPPGARDQGELRDRQECGSGESAGPQGAREQGEPWDGHQTRRAHGGTRTGKGAARGEAPSATGPAAAAGSNAAVAEIVGFFRSRHGRHQCWDL